MEPLISLISWRCTWSLWSGCFVDLLHTCPPIVTPLRYIGLETALACGMCILSSCPGGTASNIVAYIGKVRARTCLSTYLFLAYIAK